MEGEREAENGDNCVPDLNRQEREGMSEGWRSDTGCANEQHIQTLSAMGTKKQKGGPEAGSLDFGTT